MQVVGPLYADVLLEAGRQLGTGQQMQALWPAVDPREPWNAALEGFLAALVDLPVVPSTGSQLLTPRHVIFPDAMAARWQCSCVTRHLPR